MLPIVTRTTTGGKDSAGRCAFKLYWEAYEGILKQKTKCKQCQSICFPTSKTNIQEIIII